MDSLELKVIARIESDFPEKFGIPRQSGIVPALRSTIRFEPEFRNADALRGLDGFSHLWLLWIFSENVRDTWKPTVRPPRLGGNTRLGVFATRSSFRPNPIAMSCVKIEEIRLEGCDGPEIVVSGADLMDGTPIVDIKPYLPYADACEGRFRHGSCRRQAPRRHSRGTRRRSSCRKNGRPQGSPRARPAPALPRRPRTHLRVSFRRQGNQVQGQRKRPKRSFHRLGLITTPGCFSNLTPKR